MNILDEFRIRGISTCATGDKVSVSMKSGCLHHGRLLHVGHHALFIDIHAEPTYTPPLGDTIGGTVMLSEGRVRINAKSINKIYRFGSVEPTIKEKLDG